MATKRCLGSLHSGRCQRWSISSKFMKTLSVSMALDGGRPLHARLTLHAALKDNFSVLKYNLGSSNGDDISRCRVILSQLLSSSSMSYPTRPKAFSGAAYTFGGGFNPFSTSNLMLSSILLLVFISSSPALLLSASSFPCLQFPAPPRPLSPRYAVLLSPLILSISFSLLASKASLADWRSLLASDEEVGSSCEGAM